ncbi:xyloglucan endotransglucosylase/hydrolase protein 31-like [Oryza brachyantha]|uniref:xyloglucan endotransglucosylase/hydrolase protein 31-like n=1 Tax=Oryza brachyantha TaxID=4533 RepID=UPI001AD9A39B|nr:xyloglucan endotransglucosylase/hydrolase protein 31-like [Oryza brachyantha]
MAILCGRRQQRVVVAAAALMAVAMAAARAQEAPSPGLYPSKMFRSREFGRDFASLWGAEHQQQQETGPRGVTVWLDSRSGSGFKSRRAYRSGYFGAWVRLQPGYTAGVITAFYLSNGEAHPGRHDEVDMEFLGTTPGRPYTLQTNVFALGSGDPPRSLGREIKFHLWFDPTADFHHYAILWTPAHIIFFVDDVPIRRYGRRGGGEAAAAAFPVRPMWVYGSIWDASSWATEDGRYRADYRYEPFVARFSGFLLRGCSPHAPRGCAAPLAGDLTARQLAAMRWAQRFHMVYHYCLDPKRDHSLTPECRRH